LSQGALLQESSLTEEFCVFFLLFIHLHAFDSTEMEALWFGAGGLGLSAVGPARCQKRMFALEIPSQAARRQAPRLR
jgi:hypothetical protein